MLQIEIKKILTTQRGRLKNFGILLLANIFIAGVGFLTTIKIANTLGAAKFGELAYALAIGGILAINVRFGMDRSLIRDLTHYPANFNETLAASLLARGFLLILCIVGLFTLMVLPINSFNIPSDMLWVILATAVLPLQLTNVFDIWEQQGRHAIYDCIQKTVYFTMIWSGVYFFPEHFGLTSIGIALLVGAFLFLFLQYRYAWQRLRPVWQWHSIAFSQIARTAFSLVLNNKWLWFASLASLGMYAINKLILKHLADYSSLGVYAASFQLISLATLLLKNIARIGRPILARRTMPDRATASGTIRFLMFYMAACIIAVSIIALPSIVIPKLILTTFFIQEYSSGFWVLRIFGIYLFFRVFDTVLGQYLILLHMDRFFFATTLIASIVGLICCLILVPQYGAIGAAIALLTGECLVAIIYFSITFFSLKYHKQSVVINAKKQQ